MTRVDANGSLHAGDGKFAGHILGEGDAGLLEEPATPDRFRDSFVYANISGMELTLNQAAEISGHTVRWLQHAAATGDLPLHRVLGRTQTVESTIFRAWMRAQRRGRRWEDRIRLSAISLLEGGSSSLPASRNSELRTVLRGLDAGGIAHRLGAARGWYRFRSATHSRDEVAKGVMPTASSGLDADLADRTGLVQGADELHGRTDDLESVESRFGLVLDDEGDILLADSLRTGTGDLAVLMDLYLFGYSRTAQTAATAIERMARSC